MNFLLEVGLRSISGLQDLDVLFKRLKVAKRTEKSKVVRELEIKLEKLFGVPFIIEFHAFGELSENFAVLPYIKPDKNVKLKEKKDIIKFINVKNVVLVLGNEMIKNHTPRELTAILLHEIGHLLNHLSQARQLFTKMLYPIHMVLNGLKMMPLVGLVVFPLYVLSSRSLYFTQHIGEYQADKFAAKMGYGDELMSAIKKWDKSKTSFKESLTLLQRISLIGRLLQGSTHPSDKDRIEKLIKYMKKDYVSKYKNKRIVKMIESYQV